MHPLKWRHANECRLLTIGKTEVVSMYKGRCRGGGSRVRRGGSRGKRGGVGVGGEE